MLCLSYCPKSERETLVHGPLLKYVLLSWFGQGISLTGADLTWSFPILQVPGEPPGVAPAPSWSLSASHSQEQWTNASSCPWLSPTESVEWSLAWRHSVTQPALAKTPGYLQGLQRRPWFPNIQTTNLNREEHTYVILILSNQLRKKNLPNSGLFKADIRWFPPSSF